MERTRILIADDHPTFREGLCRLLEDEKDIEIVAQAGDGEETVRLAKELQPDVAVIDVAMPKLNGIEAARQIGAACPTTAILMVSAFSHEAYVLAAFEAGAAGYVLKNLPVGELLSAIRLVRSGGSVFDLKAVKKLLGRASTAGDARRGLPILRGREIEVLKQAVKGMTNRAIAQELGIGERTVQTHMVNIFRKLEVASRTQAVSRALRQGWLTPDDLL